MLSYRFVRYFISISGTDGSKLPGNSDLVLKVLSPCSKYETVLGEGVWSEVGDTDG